MKINKFFIPQITAIVYATVKIFDYINCITDPGGFIFDQIDKYDKKPHNGLLDF